MSLHVRAAVPGRLDVDLHVQSGAVVAVLGPNGAGKSTLLGVVAGLQRPRGAHVILDDADVSDLPPYRRDVALLAQDPLLFPHLSVADNVAFGPRAAGVRRSDARRLAVDLLDRLGVGDLAARRPHQLSGGQAQRVAIARAMATEPRVLLLDEPMAALDADVRPALRQTLRHTLRQTLRVPGAERTTLLVTHDVLDALLLADRVVVLEHGRVVEDGPTREVLVRPRSTFAARLAGLDLVVGTWDGSAVHTAIGPVHGLLEEGERAEPGDQVLALFRPAAVSIFPGGPEAAPAGSPRNRVAVIVTDLEPLGDRVRVRGRAGREADGVHLTAEVTPAAVADLGLVPGATVTFSVKATEVCVYGTFKARGGPE